MRQTERNANVHKPGRYVEGTVMKYCTTLTTAMKHCTSKSSLSLADVKN